MAQTVITKAFTEWKAQQAIDNQPVNLDEFIFAYIPDLDVTKPVDNTEGLPPADNIVHRQVVSKSGVVNSNSVVYSVTLGADVGDFNFNWIGLANKETSTLAMIIHAPTQRKIKNASGQQGNVLVRSMLMEYSGAELATNITTPAETWQIDFTARLAAMDERQRLENIDLYGGAAFFGTGYLVSKNGSQFFVTQGAGYVAGLRSVLAANQNITVSAKPVKVWLDVAWSGTLTSEWTVQSKITVAASLVNYAENGVQHHVFALASIDESGTIADLRPKGSLNEQQADSDFVRKAQNLADLNDKAEARKNIGLGTAATSDVTESSTDNTDYRLMRVGDFGLGLAAVNIDLPTANINAFPYPAFSGFRRYSPSSGAHQIGISGYGFINDDTGYFAELVMPLTGTGKAAVRNASGTQYLYTDKNKPSASDVDAVSASEGGIFQKEVWFPGGAKIRTETGMYSGGDAASLSDANMLLKSWYGIGFYNTCTQSGTQGITGYINVRTGYLEMRGQIVPGNYSNFDSRYYTQTAANSKFVTAVRMGASSTYQERSNAERLTGGVMTSWRDAGSSNYWLRLRPLQYLINGTWHTAAYA